MCPHQRQKQIYTIAFFATFITRLGEVSSFHMGKGIKGDQVLDWSRVISGHCMFSPFFSSGGREIKLLVANRDNAWWRGMNLQTNVLTNLVPQTQEKEKAVGKGADLSNVMLCAHWRPCLKAHTTLSDVVKQTHWREKGTDTIYSPFYEWYERMIQMGDADLDETWQKQC